MDQIEDYADLCQEREEVNMLRFTEVETIFVNNGKENF